MKSMILVLTPEEAVNLLNGDLSVLVRKEFPKDFIGWINVYVKKDRKNKFIQEWDTDDCGYGHYFVDAQVYTLCKPKKPKTPEPTGVIDSEELPDDWEDYYINLDWYDYVKEHNDNGKVIAKFWCDKVEEIETDYPPRDTFFKECGLTAIELLDYIGHSKWHFWHISKLEIFETPKDISEFNTLQRAKATDCGYLKQCKKCGRRFNRCHLLKPLTKAPTNYCYVEV